MNIYGVLKDQLKAHPKEDPHHIQLGVLKAYRKAETEFTGKWGRWAYEATFNSALLFATGIGGHVGRLAAFTALGVGEAMRFVPPFLVARDTGRQIEGHHFKPDAPDSRFARRTAELADMTLH